jgi:flagellin
MFVTRFDCRPETLFKDIFDPNTITVDVDGVPTEVTLTALVTEPWEKATASLIAIDMVFSKISEFRATAGAQHNRLEHTNNRLAIAHTNLETALSRIRDTDIAKEIMENTKSNILQQAATAMLTQANQAPNAILQLLQG